MRLYGSNVDGPVIRFENTNVGNSGRTYHVGSTAGSGAGSGFSIYDLTGSTTRLLINYNGNVGIGTTNPGSALQVNGTVTATAFSGSVTGASSFNVLKTGDTMSGALSITNATSSVSTTTGALVVTGGLGLSGQLVSSNTIYANYGGVGSYGQLQLFPASNNGEASVIFAQNAAGSSAASWRTGINVNSAGNNTFGIYSSTLNADALVINSSGYVGIGTTTPQTALDVVGGIRSSGNLVDASMDFVLGNGDQVSRGNSGSSRALVKNAGNVLGLNFAGDFTGGTAIQGATGTTNFFVSAAANGNVGIGTTAPNSPLHVYNTVNGGGIYLDGNTSNGLSLLTSGTVKGALGVANSIGSFSTDASMGDIVIRSQSSQKILLNANGGTSLSSLAINGGNVGIGTTTPGSTLEVNGAIKSTSNSNGGTTINFSSGNLQYTNQTCGAYILYNVQSGGTYQLAIQGTTGGTCSFTVYSDAGTTLVGSVKTAAVNLVQSAGSQMLFSFSNFGGTVYVSSINGY
jgi:hypothetical protein